MSTLTQDGTHGRALDEWLGEKRDWMDGIRHLMLRILILILFKNCIIHVEGFLDFNLIYATILSRITVNVCLRLIKKYL